jgi:hypothetical protein
MNKFQNFTIDELLNLTSRPLVKAMDELCDRYDYFFLQTGSCYQLPCNDGHSLQALKMLGEVLLKWKQITKYPGKEELLVGGDDPGPKGALGEPGLYYPDCTLEDLDPNSRDYGTLERTVIEAKQKGAWVVFKRAGEQVGTPSVGSVKRFLYSSEYTVGFVVKELSSFIGGGTKQSAFDRLRDL